MRIISKFKDYYDGLATYSKEDYTVKVWVRKKEHIKLNIKDVKIFYDLYNDVVYHEFEGRPCVKRSWMPLFVVVAGKVYPVLAKTLNASESIFFYNMDSLLLDENFCKAFPEKNYFRGRSKVEKMFSYAYITEQYLQLTVCFPSGDIWI